MHARDIYGLSRWMGPGVPAKRVETKDGLHIWEDFFDPEIISPEDRPVRDVMARRANWCSPRSKEAMR